MSSQILLPGSTGPSGNGQQTTLGVMGGAATVMAAAFWRRNWLRTR